MIQPPRESDDAQGPSGRSSAPTMLKALLRERHLQNYGMFKRAYQKAAKGLDKDLVETYPSVQTFRRWLAGRITTLRPVLSIDLDHFNAGLRQQLSRVYRELSTLQNKSLLVRNITTEIDNLLTAQTPTTGRSAGAGSDA